MKKGLALLLCVCLALTALAGCSGKTKEMQKVTVCEVTHSIFYAPQYVALAKGFFADEGLDVELSNGGGADKVMSAVLSGNVDIGFAGPEASIYVYNEGKEDYTEVFAQVTKCDGSFLVGREKDASFTWDKLAGKHILPGRKGGVPYMAFEYAIRKNGMDPASDLLLDNSIQFDNMTGAFLGGTGDYVTMFEPTASSVEAEGKGYIVAAVGEEAGEMPYTAYFAKKSFIEKNADMIQRFTNAVYKGQKWVAEHSAAEIAEVVKDSFPDTDIALLTSAVQRYKDIGAYSTDPVLTQESFDLLQTVMTAAGELEKTARKQYLCGKGDAVKRYDTIKKRPAKGALTQENIGFGLTVLAHSVLKKPGNPQRIARLFSRTVHPKPPGQNCAAPLKREFSMQSKENCRRHPLWLSRRFDEAMRGNSRFKDDVFLRQHA